ncbi:hypothetical protein F4861DRAFT_290112 [Xylaria intraflava]|nr:hypothetical protein F4861DRAFT_290112 [Xylaria intraflava]
MIRQSLKPAVGRTRADLDRVSDGIAATLRAFSTAQQLAAPDNSDRNTFDEDSSQPTTRQRAAAAADELVNLGGGMLSQPSGLSFRTVTVRSDAPNAGALSFGSGISGGYSGGGIDAVKPDTQSGDAGGVGRPPGLVGVVRAPTIIRGGFRGRGGGLIGRGAGFVGRGAGFVGRGAGFIGRGSPVGFGRRFKDTLDRRDRLTGGLAPRGRRSRPSRDIDEGNEGEREGGGGFEDYPEEVKAMRDALETGEMADYIPSLSLNDLVGFGPAVATDGSSFAKNSTVVRQARILGGAETYHPQHTLLSRDMWKRYTLSTGLFFPTEEAKKWAAEVMGVKAFAPVPKETKDAILQDTLLGIYHGADPNDSGTTLGVVRNYVAQNNSWNADACRRVEEKIKSLLPGAKDAPVQMANGTSASA